MSYISHPTAIIDENSKIHSRVFVGPNTCIGKCDIGENTVIDGNCYIYSNVRIGKNVIINAGTIIGVDGCGYERAVNGELQKFPHVGGVDIGDNVRIGANVVIVKGVLDDTTIGEGTKIGNQCNIGHNVVIGRHCFIYPQAINGSVRIGDYSWIAPGACIRNKVVIGNNVMVGMGSVVTKDIPDGNTVFGVPAKTHDQLR